MGSCRFPCYKCRQRHFHVFERSAEPTLPEHLKCDCQLIFIERKVAGTISKKGVNGPDYFLKYFNRLPSYYITKKEAESIYSWDSKKSNLAEVAPGKMIGGDSYMNYLQYLPEKEGRLWYECDVDYENGYRNSLRLFFSNDGLMFYSTNHGNSEFIFVE